MLLWLCVLELGLLAAAAGWETLAVGGGVAPGDKAVALFLIGGVVILAASVMLARIYRRSDAAGRRAFQLGIVANLVAVCVALAGTEALLRVVAVATSQGLAIGPVTLPPTWNETRAHNAGVLATSSGFREQWLSYVVSDPDLGWTVGSNRRTPDGMYFSSVEGLRSGRPDVVYADRRPALRIALVGDSFTFSMDGPFEDSWGYQLEQLLGPDVQVLNFGVDGYGVDQAWLRYRRDVTRWHPDIVLFGLIQHDLVRTVAVYPFLSFRWDYPFAKPRFAPAGGELRLLNTPLITAAEILAHDDPGSLPLAAYDLGYQQGDWRWRRGNLPLVLRLFGEVVRRDPARSLEVSDGAAMAISGRLLQSFLRQASVDGSAARILYFPSGAGDFGGSVPAEARIARRMLAAYAPEHLDLTACVAAVAPDLRLIPGRVHYTRQANAKVAGCVAADLAALGWLRRPPGITP